MSVNQIKGKFIRLSNNEALKSGDAAGTGEVEILKVDASDQVVLLELPIVDDGVSPASNVSTEAYVDGEISTVNGRIDDHVNGDAEKHNAADIVVEAGISGLAATDVQAALSEISGDAAGAQSTIDNHISNPNEAHAASAIGYEGTASGLVALTVQAAIDEVEARVDALEVGGGDTKQVKISANDTAEGYVEDKIVGASGKISISTLNDGGDEDLQISIGSDVFDKTVDGAGDVSYSNSNGELIATNVQAAIDELSTRTASDWDYSNSNGELIATNVQAAIDELSLRDASDWGYDNATSGLTAADVQAAIDELALEKVDLAGDTMTGFLTLHADPSSDYHAATKKYVDAIAEGLHVHAPVKAIATYDLGGTYNNGSSGVGAHLDFAAPIATIDGLGAPFSVGDRFILAKQQGNVMDVQNGIYYIEDSADINVSGEILKLTRSQDFNTPTEMAGGDFVFVQEGSTYADTGWVMTEKVIAVGTTPVQFLQFSGAGEYSAGPGLELNGTEFSVLFDDSSIGLNGSGELEIKLDGVSTGMLQNDSVTSDKIADFAVTSSQIDSSVAGDAMEKDTFSGKLDVRVDGTRIGIDMSNQLYIPMGGVNTNELANDSVTSDKIADFAVTQAQIDSSVAGDAMEKDTFSGKLDVRVDGTRIGIDMSNQLYIPMGGVNTNELANDSVTSDKIADFAVTSSQIDSSVAGDAMEKDTFSGKLDVRVDGTRIGIDMSNQLYIPMGGVNTNELANDSVTTDKIADLAVTQAQIDSSVAGDAMEKDTFSGKLDVRVDGTRIGIDMSNQLYIPMGGVNTNELANDSVTTDKIADLAVTQAQIDSSVAGDGLEKDLITGKLDIKPQFSTIADISVSSSGLSIANRWHKEAITLDATDISNGYVDLSFSAEDKSIVAFVDRLAIHEGAETGDTLNDYWVEIQGGVTRVNFMNALIAPGPQSLAVGDNLFFTYQKKAS
jgi:hypothetical protein